MADSTSAAERGSGAHVHRRFQPWWEILLFNFIGFLILTCGIYIVCDFSSTLCMLHPKESCGESSSAASRELCEEFLLSQSAGEIYEKFHSWGVNMLLKLLMLCVLYLSWYIIPSVRRCFLAVEDADERMGKNNIRMSRLVEFAATTKPNLANCESAVRREMSMVVKVCCSLYLRECHKFSLFWLYIARNVAICVAAAPVLSELWASVADQAESVSSVANGKIVCISSALRGVQIPSLIMFCLLIGITLTALVVLTLTFSELRSLNTSENASKRGRILAEDYAFVAFFAQHSRSLRHSTREVLFLLRDDHALHAITKQNPIRPQGVDVKVVALLLYLHKNGTQKLAEQLNTFFKKCPTPDLGVSLSLLHQLRSEYRINLSEDLFSGKHYNAFFRFHDVIFTDSDSCVKKCDCDISLTLNHMVDRRFLHEVQVRRLNVHGRNVIKHILIQLLPKTERESFLAEFSDFTEFIDRLVDLGLRNSFNSLLTRPGATGCPRLAELSLTIKSSLDPRLNKQSRGSEM